MTVIDTTIPRSAGASNRYFLFQWHQPEIPKQISLPAPEICPVCGSPEVVGVDRVYHRNMNFPHIEWSCYLPVQVCVRHQGSWRFRIWTAFLLGIAGLLTGTYLVFQNPYLGFSVIGVCVGICLLLVYWRDPAARMIRIESYRGFSLIQPRNADWAQRFLEENGAKICEIPDVLGTFRRKRKILFSSSVAVIVVILISLAIVIPLWDVLTRTSELLQHPEFVVGLISLTIAGVMLGLMLPIGLDQLMREKEKVFRKILPPQKQPAVSQP